MPISLRRQHKVQCRLKCTKLIFCYFTTNSIVCIGTYSQEWDVLGMMTYFHHWNQVSQKWPTLTDIPIFSSRYMGSCCNKGHWEVAQLFLLLFICLRIERKVSSQRCFPVKSCNSHTRLAKNRWCSSYKQLIVLKYAKRVSQPAAIVKKLVCLLWWRTANTNTYAMGNGRNKLQTVKIIYV